MPSTVLNSLKGRFFKSGTLQRLTQKLEKGKDKQQLVFSTCFPIMAQE